MPDTTLCLNKSKLVPMIDNLLTQRSNLTERKRPILHKLLQHWTMPVTKKSKPPIVVYRASPKAIRTYWYEQDTPRPSAKPPYDFPLRYRLSPQHWSIFWSLNIPHQVRNFWWRILIEKNLSLCFRR
ncbi:hypothetical protein BC941DRAFT_446614 [Chlamydoabsidia padenii]|nr:hypothetical protein BC941DRAFT_446614 [Chlamydoabsidia padenii]